jgi:ubiquinone/menaquinone biosynthesis C-methylase UbiE
MQSAAHFLMLSAAPGLRLLDVACGPGYVAAAAAPQFRCQG